MGSINVQGVGTFTVPDTFSSLSPADQASAVDEMIASVHGSASAGPSATTESLPNDPDVPLGDQAGAGAAARSGLYAALPGSLKRGFAYAETGAADTLDALGAHGVATDLRDATDKTAAAQPSTTGDLVSSLRQGRLLRAATDVPGAVMEGLPSALPAIGAAALSDGAAIPLMVGAATGGLTQAGDIAQARAARDGRSTPDGTDLAVGLGAGAGLGAVGTIGLGEVGSSALGGVMRSAVARAALHGAADAGVAAGQNVAATAGTNGGVQLDPAQIGAQAILGAGTRAVLSGVGGATGAISDRLDGTTAAARTQAQAATFDAMDPQSRADLVNRAAALAALKGTQGNAADTVTPTAPAIAARTTVRDLSQGVGDLAATLQKQGIIDKDGVGTIGRALSEARNSQGALTQDHLDAIDQLGIDDPTSDLLKSSLGQIDLLSDAGIAKRGVGPAEGALRALGGEAAGGVIGSIGGGPVGAGLGIVAGHFLKPYVAGLLGGFGSKLDQVMGTSQPSLVKEGAAATQMLQSAGLPVPDTRGDLLAAVQQQRSAIATQAKMMGLDASRYGGPGAATADSSASAATNAEAQPQPGAMGAAAARAAARGVLSGQPEAADTSSTPDYAPEAAPLSQELNGVLAQASARAGRSQAPGGAPAGSTAAPSMSEPMPLPAGVPPDAALQGQLLPEYQWGLGRDLQAALVSAGSPRPVNYAGAVKDAIGSLQDDGLFDQDFADKLMSHDGRVTRGLYNLLRSRMILEAGGGDRRVLAAQQPMTAAGVLPLAAE